MYIDLEDSVGSPHGDSSRKIVCPHLAVYLFVFRNLAVVYLFSCEHIVAAPENVEVRIESKHKHQNSKKTV
jgi:hypothetical protein